MPRTSALECPGCPPIRALTFDVLGLVKVIEARGQQGGVPKVVERWGEPDSSKCVLAASINDRKFHPLLAVARKSGVIEVFSPVNGNLHVSLAANVGDADLKPEDSAIVGLHLFRKQMFGLSSRFCTLLTCTTKGNASIRSVDFSDPSIDPVDANSWSVCGAGNIYCSKVDQNENYALFGGKGVELNVWDLENFTKIWTAKSPPKNSLDIFTPTWFTSATFLNKDDHRKIVAGTNSHQVRLYDISAQRRPVMSFDFRETPIKAVTEDPDGHTIYFGNGSGDLASVDIRTGKLLGCFLGKCSGSIRSIARHPELPVIASCGLDSHLRFWDIKTRQLLSAVFLKQHLTNVVIDSNFSDEVPAVSTVDTKLQDLNEIQDGDEEIHPVKRKKAERENGTSKKPKSKKNDVQDVNDIEDGDEEIHHVKRKKAHKENGTTKKPKSKKNEVQELNEIEDLDEEIPPVKRNEAQRENGSSKKSKTKKDEVLDLNEIQEEDEEMHHMKRQKAHTENGTGKKPKSKKSKTKKDEVLDLNEIQEEDEEMHHMKRQKAHTEKAP